MSTISFDKNTSVYPQALYGSPISPQVFETYKIQRDQARGNATAQACLIEFGICCCFGLFCVFCCHPCIADGVTDWNLVCRNVNQAHFHGSSVFTVTGNNVICYPHNIASGQAGAATTTAYMNGPGPNTVYNPPMTNATVVNGAGDNQLQPSNPNYVTANNYSTGSTNDAYLAARYGHDSDNAQTGGSIPIPSQYEPVAQQQQRLMAVTIPPGLTPGQSMQCQAPTGQVVQIVVPPGVHAGQQIQVAY